MRRNEWLESAYSAIWKIWIFVEYGIDGKNFFISDEIYEGILYLTNIEEGFYEIWFFSYDPIVYECVFENMRKLGFSIIIFSKHVFYGDQKARRISDICIGHIDELLGGWSRLFVHIHES